VFGWGPATRIYLAAGATGISFRSHGFLDLKELVCVRAVTASGKGSTGGASVP
jgi:hypothetical protein